MSRSNSKLLSILTDIRLKEENRDLQDRLRREGVLAEQNAKLREEITHLSKFEKQHAALTTEMEALRASVKIQLDDCKTKKFKMIVLQERFDRRERELLNEIEKSKQAHAKDVQEISHMKQAMEARTADLVKSLKESELMVESAQRENNELKNSIDHLKGIIRDPAINAASVLNLDDMTTTQSDVVTALLAENARLEDANKKLRDAARVAQSRPPTQASKNVQSVHDVPCKLEPQSTESKAITDPVVNAPSVLDSDAMAGTQDEVVKALLAENARLEEANRALRVAAQAEQSRPSTQASKNGQLVHDLQRKLEREITDSKAHLREKAQLQQTITNLQKGLDEQGPKMHDLRAQVTGWKSRFSILHNNYIETGHQKMLFEKRCTELERSLAQAKTGQK